MKHGVAFRKLSRTSSHRMLMLRNLVTSLVEHEQIKTTLAKAKETARLAEKIITLGKKGDLPAARRAQGFLLKPTLVSKVFGMLAHRYARRPGGYTRIHRFGNRLGDNAPHAILELVDNPRDLRFDLTARSVGWELLGSKLMRGKRNIIDAGVEDIEAVVRKEKNPATDKPGYLRQGLGGRLRRFTQNNLRKVLRYRGDAGVKDLSARAEKYAEELIVEPVAHVGMRRFVEEQDNREALLATYNSMTRRQLQAGMRRPTSEKSAYSISSGILQRRGRGTGMGVPGGWFKRKRLGLREEEHGKEAIS